LEGVLNVWVAPRGDLEAATPVTKDAGRGIRFYAWAFTSNHILYLQDQDGDEDWHIYIVDLKTKSTRDLTPFEGVHARLWRASPDHPEEVVIGLNNRDPQWHDLFRINIETGERTLLLQNDSFAEMTVDDDYAIRFAARMTEDGGMDWLKPAGDDSWEPWDSIPSEDALTTSGVGFNKAGDTLFMRDSRGRNTSALVAKNYRTGETRLLAEDVQADIHDVVRHPTEKHVQAASFIYERKHWQVLDRSIEEDLSYLHSITDGELRIEDRTLDDGYWIVLYVVDDGPARYYLYNRTQRKAIFLFTERKDLEQTPLAPMHSAVIKSRDGLDLVAYYTLPLGCDSDNDGIPDAPLPTVFIPHGGPWGRDFWGWSARHQWLANRGYAALCVNFRSSTGFGKDFVNAGDLEWAGKIHEDQIDAVQWAIASGLSVPDRVAVMGGSFGGYSTLAGLTFSPEVFACGVDLVGPSNLITLLESMPPYWKPMLELFTSRVGDHRTEEGRALLEKHSPLTHVDRICRPLLIGQGGQRSEGEEGRVRSDRRCHEGKESAGNLRAVPGRGARLRASGEQHVLQRYCRSLPG
jgi:dipeptidyl aminopeptidase/acylaminoacyl peptidase